MISLSVSGHLPPLRLETFGEGRGGVGATLAYLTPFVGPRVGVSNVAVRPR